MIRVNQYIINEKLIKVAVPYFMPPEEGIESGYPPPATKITFTDNSELIFKNMDVNILFNELERQQNKCDLDVPVRKL